MDFPRRSPEFRRSLDSAAKRYAESLTPEALTYLEGRGIPAHVAHGRLLGSVVEPEQGHEHATGWLSIPYVTPSGVVAIKFRRIGSDAKPKCLAVEGQGSHLYGVCDLHRPSDVIAICEGELDCVVLSELCGVPTVATSVGTWEPFWRRLFEDYAKVYIVLDPDEPGKNFAKKLRDKIQNSVIVDLEIGDVNEAYLKEGPEFIRQKIGLE